MPDYPPHPGQPFLDPALAPQVPEGAPRPLAPGEYVQNPDGSWSSEITVTVTNPQLERRRSDRHSVPVDRQWAAGEGQRGPGGSPSRCKAGLDFQHFADIPAAEQFAEQRESSWQGLTDPKAAVRSPRCGRKPRPMR